MNVPYFAGNAPTPKRKSEEIRNNLVYSVNDPATIIDEFTLNLWKKKMEDLLLSLKGDPQDYEALGLIYFNLRKFDEFFSVLDQGIRNFQSVSLLGSRTIGEITISEINNEIKISPYLEKYFLVQLREFGVDTITPFGFNRNAYKFSYGEKIYNYKNVATFELLFEDSEWYTAKIGPYIFKRPVFFLETTKLDNSFALIQEICSKITEGEFLGVYKDFVEHLFPNYFIDHLIEIATPREFIGV